MSEQLNSNRIIFPKNHQALFLQHAKDSLGISWPKFAKELSVHPRVLNDWKREEYSLPEIVGLEIVRRTGVTLPNDIQLKNKYWYTSKGGKIAGPLIYKKYGLIGGDPIKRKEQWNKWWEENDYINNLGNYAIQKEISIPSKSIKLAELVGILLGDGGITSRQVKITLDSENDKAFSTYVISLLVELFNITPSVRKHAQHRAIDIVVSRTALVSYLEEIGVSQGNKIKKQVDIPDWIKERPDFALACVRGLMDTDGSIFLEKHLVKGKEYTYPRLWFVSKSTHLRESVFKILAEAGFYPKVRSERAVTLEKRDDIVKYFKDIGTHNPKHQERFINFMEKCVSGRNRRS